MPLPNYATDVISFDEPIFPKLPDIPRWEPKELNERHHEIIRMKVKGSKNADIARALSITEVSVFQILRSTLAKQRIAELEMSADIEAIDIKEEIDKACAEAVLFRRDTMNDPLAKMELREKISADFLDRGGFAKVTKIESNNRGYLGVGLQVLIENAEKAGIGVIPVEGEVINVKASSESQAETCEEEEKEEVSS